MRTKFFHISDIHFSNKTGIPDTTRENLCNWIKNNVLRTNEKFNFLVFTGDLTTKNDQNYLEKGFSYLLKLSSAAGKCPILLTPGNHDVLWPDSPKEFFYWGDKERYSDYFKCLRKIMNPQPTLFVHPILYKKDTTPSRVNEAITKYIREKKYEKKDDLKNIYSDFAFPFYWDWENRVFCYLLSSVDLSGNLFIPPGDNKDTVKKILNGIGDKADETTKYLYQRAFRRDIPFVFQEQLNILENICEILRKDEGTKEAFNNSLKLAILHHPLSLGLGEEEIREFSCVVNGPKVMESLSDNEFTLILYGHTHCNSKSMYFGNWKADDGDNYTYINESAAISGAIVYNQYLPLNPSIQIIEVQDNANKNNLEKIIYAKTYYINKKRKVEDEIISIDKSGKIRWLKYEKGRNKLSRKQSINKDFHKVFNEVESQLFKHNSEKINELKDVDDFFRSFFSFLNGYSKGTYGLDNTFINNLKKDFETQKALYFIDIIGSSSWAHSIFLKHLAEQLRIYTEKNFELIYTYPNQWSHTEPIEKALKRLKCHYCKEDEEFKDSNPAGIKRKPKLKLDICRILIWTEKELKSIPGNLLITLHDVFKVPLFYLDRDILKKMDIPEEDYHLVFNVDQITDHTRPISGAIYKTMLGAGKKDRIDITSDEYKQKRSQYYSNFLWLINNKNLKFAKNVVKK